MKLITKTFLVSLLIFMVFAGAAFASTVDRYLADGRKLVLEAEQANKDNRPDKRDVLFKDAIKTYTRLLKEYPKSVEAAQAQLEIAKVQEKLGMMGIGKAKSRHETEALQSYTRIRMQYGQSRQKLEAKFGSDASHVQQIVNEANNRHDALAKNLDKISSKKPLYKIMDFLVDLTGRRPWLSYWLAIIIITVIVKILITPLTKAQFKGMREMQRIQPLIKEIQEKYKGNQRELGEKVMALYKEHGINPFASCLPLLIQLPIMLLLYNMIRLYEFQFQNGYFLWIGSPLSKIFPWVAANLSQPDIPLVVLYTISMIISMRLSNVDPTQAQQQKIMSLYMPILFAFLFKSFPSAFLLYWLVFNILTTSQQYFIIHGHVEPVIATEPSTSKIVEEKPQTKPSGARSRSRRRRR